MKYTHTKEIKNYLKEKGYASFVIDKGLNYLIPSWEKSIKIFSDRDLIYDYINDLDGRKIIDEIIEFLSKEEKQIVQEELERIDTKFKKKTFEINECIYSKRIEEKHGYNRKKNWYYYRITESIFNTEQKYTKKDSCEMELS